LEEDRAADTGNMRKKIGKDRACGSGDILADRQTDPQTDILITIVSNRSRVATTRNNTANKCVKKQPIKVAMSDFVQL